MNNTSTLPRRTIKIIQPCEKTVIFPVNTDKTDLNLLEDVFDWFNGGSGKESPLFTNMRSLSVNDFVIIDDNIYQCASVGWKNVDEDYMYMIINNVTDLVDADTNNHYSPWYFLNEIMWNMKKSVVVK